MSIVQRRVTAKIEGDFVVFLIGARINRPWKVPKLLWFGSVMPKLIKELKQRPDSGFLGVEFLGLAGMVQYWRSLEHLMSYARSRDYSHFPAWVEFNKRVASNGDIGIWHETYCVRAGEYECVYNNMPAFGLAKATATVDAAGALHTASGRLGKTDGSDDPTAG
jgi:hypothetical protein